MIRGSPSTVRVSLANARRLSRVRALDTPPSNCLISFVVPRAASNVRISSTSSRAYQRSIVAIRAKRLIASR